MDSATNHSTGSYQLSKQDRVPTHKVLVKGSRENEVYIRNVVDLEDHFIQMPMLASDDLHRY
jgi:hypothetical protein